MQQMEIEVLYNLRCESAATMFELWDVVTYVAKRVGLIPGRIWFGAGAAINMTLTGYQRRNFLHFLNRHNLSYYLVFGDFHRKQPRRFAVLTGRGENTWVDPEERTAQIISFAYGNVKLHNPAITREDVERAYEQLTQERT